MITLNNAEGSKFNANVDNYLVINLIDQSKEDITFEQLEWLVETVSNFHSEPLCVEANGYTFDLIDYLINIDKLTCFNTKKISSGVYYTVRFVK